MPNPNSRSRRFQRAAQAPAMQLTERDVEIIRQVHKHRFLRSDQIAALCPGSQQNLLRRLKLLYHNRFLDRPRAQSDYYRQNGNQALVYALGNRGADVLSERLSVPRRKINWQSKNQAAQRMFLQHTLLVAGVMLKLETASRRTHVRLIERDELLAQCPEETKHKPNPFKWNAHCTYNGIPLSLGLHPDKVFGLRFQDQPRERNTAYFFLEADRATMPVTRAGFERTSLFRKLLAYQESWKQGLHERHFNIRRFCVLIVTTSQARIHSLVEANKHFSQEKGSRLFLFADKSFPQAGNVLTAPLLNGASEITTLLDIIA